MKLLKNLFGKNGEYKIHPDEIHLGDYVVERGGDATEGYIKWNSGALDFWMRGDIFVGADTYTQQVIPTPVEAITGGNATATLRNNSSSWLNIEINRAMFSTSGGGGVNIALTNKANSSATATVQIKGTSYWK